MFDKVIRLITSWHREQIMLVAKQGADLITWSRGKVAFILVGMGSLGGSDVLPWAASVMILDRG
jgi:hypothetical protein